MSTQKTEQREPLPLRVIDFVTQALNVTGSLLILALVVLVGLDVAGRNLFGLPISGVPELVTLSIVAIVFLQIPQALKQGRMTRTELLDALLKNRAPGVLKLIESLFDFLGISVVAIIVWATWPIFTKAWLRNDFIGAVGDFTAPTWPVKATILFGGTVLILQFGIRILRRHGWL